MDYVIGLDLGQVADYTALVVMECHWSAPPGAQFSYQVRHLERLLGQPYPAIVARVTTVMAQPPLVGQRTHLVADATGCGRPVIDLLHQAKLHPMAVTIHGGDQVHRDGRHYRVPKRDLVGSLQVCLQTERLKIAKDLELAPTLVQELLSFRVKIDPATAHDAYSAWREKDHDDLVLATALCTWWSEQQGRYRAGVWGVVPIRW
jgi:hypothetical protein